MSFSHYYAGQNHLNHYCTNQNKSTDTSPTTASAFDLKSQCRKCGAKLSADDVGIYMKLVTRGAKDFLCMSCLAPELNTTRENLQKVADYYRASGECVLFR